MKKLFLIITTVLVLGFVGCGSNNIKDVEEAYVKYFTSIGSSEQEINELKENFKKPEVKEQVIKEIERYKNLGHPRKEAIGLMLEKIEKSRIDAAATSIKRDIVTAISAVPAWYTGQRDARINQAMSIDTSRWSAIDDSGYGFVYKDGGKECVTMQVYEVGESDETLATSQNANEDGRWQPLKEETQPMLKISKGDSTGAICSILWSDFGLEEQTIQMGGNRIIW